MRIVVNGTAYPLRGHMNPNEYTILGYLSPMYYLCKDKDGNTFALYLPNVTVLYPSVY